MKIRVSLLLALLLTVQLAATGQAARGAKPKLEGAWKYTGLKFPGGQQTEAEAKGMIVVSGKYMAFVRATVDRKMWTQDEPKDEQTKKIVAAYQGLAATCGVYEITGNVITLNQVAQANPGSMGTSTKWEFTIEGKKLTLKPAANPQVEFFFEKLP